MNDSQKIANEIKRLTEIYAEIEEKRKGTIQGLIARAAFLKVKLEFLEADLNEKGFTEPFKQGAQEPYERQRPNAALYVSYTTNYQKIIKQLTDLLPKEAEKPQKEQGDGFEDFVIGRDDS